MSKFPDTYVKVFATNQKAEVLMLKRGTGARSDSGLMDFPGGGVEFGETYIDALIREVKEETSLALIEPRYLCQKEFFHPIKQNKAMIIWFTAKLCGDNVVLDQENNGYQWVEANNLNACLEGIMLDAHQSAVQKYLAFLQPQ